MSKLKEEELKALQGAVSKVNSLQLEIGALEAQKHDLLHAIAAANEEFKGLQKKLEEEYGQVSININTGEITKDEPSKED